MVWTQVWLLIALRPTSTLYISSTRTDRSTTFSLRLILVAGLQQSQPIQFRCISRAFGRTVHTAQQSFTQNLTATAGESEHDDVAVLPFAQKGSSAVEELTRITCVDRAAGSGARNQ